MSKNYFGVLDSRNTKYQGLLKDNSFNGIGILMDNLFTTVLTTWNKYVMNGPSIIIFPYLQIFFGQLQNNKPKGIICFQSNQKQKYLINYDTTNDKLGYQTINIAHIVSKQSIAHIEKNTTKNQYKLIQTFYCKNQDQQTKILSDIFKRTITKQQLRLKQYLQTNFVQKTPLFQFLGRKELFFGFKNTTSLGFKFQNNYPTAIGNFHKFPRNLVFGRKINYNFVLPQKTNIQQGHFQQPMKTFKFLKSQGSSFQCQKSTQQYFKKSTTFRNQFTKLDSIDKLCIQLKKIQKSIKQQTGKKIGQSLLQNDYGSSNNKPQQQIVVKQYTLSEVKQEIYKAAARRQGGHRNIQKSPLRTPVKKHIQSLYIDIQSSQRRQKRSRSKNSYLNSQDRYNQISFKLAQPQLTSRQMLYNQNSLAQRNKQFKIYQYKKPNLIRDVNQRIQSQKQMQRALIQQLIRQEEYKESVLIKQKIRSIQNSARYNYDLSPSNRYQRRVSPFILKEKQYENDSKRRKSIKRTYNYQDLSTNRQNQTKRMSIQGMRRSNETNISPRRQITPIQRLDTGNSLQMMKRRNHTQNISPFKLDELVRQNTLQHDHLTRYKQRKRQPQKNKQNVRFSYLQNEQELMNNHYQQQNTLIQKKPRQNITTNQISRSPRHQTIPQIKLFQNNVKNNDVASQLNQKINQVSQHSKSDDYLFGYHQGNISSRGNFIKASTNKSPIKSKPLYDKTNRIQTQIEMQRNLSNKYAVGYSNQSYNQLNNQGNQSKTFTNRLERNHTPTKTKRTFHYVD